ncbi:hypothetical protein AB0L41_46305 [Amycolatopsis mediterranei]|uniref:hypothetical protein n=1 Tax=Amycolatopsis mediterranei TaxID=33910 RepID=UPI00342005C6
MSGSAKPSLSRVAACSSTSTASPARTWVSPTSTSSRATRANSALVDYDLRVAEDQVAERADTFDDQLERVRATDDAGVRCCFVMATTVVL